MIVFVSLENLTNIIFELNIFSIAVLLWCYMFLLR